MCFVFSSPDSKWILILAYVKISLARHYSDHGRHRDFDVSLSSVTQSTSIAEDFRAFVRRKSRKSSRPKFAMSESLWWCAFYLLAKTKTKGKKLNLAGWHSAHDFVVIENSCFFVTTIENAKYFSVIYCGSLGLTPHEMGDDNDRTNPNFDFIIKCPASIKVANVFSTTRWRLCRV